DGEQPEPLAVVVRAKLVQRRVEGLRAENASLALVEHAEARIDACRERMRTEQPMTETVDGGDPRAVEGTRQVLPARFGEPGADARTQLARGFLRVRDHEHRLDVESLVADGAREPLHEHLRLPRPRAGGDEYVPARVDRGL